jgi:hypothetical protein
MVMKFEYAPIKVTFKKKVNLADLTPVQWKRNLLKEVIKVALISALIGVLLTVAAIAWLGGEGVEDA